MEEFNEDKKLYNLFLEGDTKAFEKLIYKYKNNLTYFIYRFVKDIDIAEDIFQEVALYVLAKKDIYNSRYSFKTYLFTIAKSRALNYIRDIEIHNKYADNIEENIVGERLLEDIIVSNDINREIKNVIDKLNPDYQTVIYLGIIEELSYTEIAEIMNKSISQIKNLLHKARVKLRKLLIKQKIVEIRDNKLVRIMSIVIIVSIIISGIGYAAYTLVSKKTLKPISSLIGFSDNFNKYTEKYNEIVEENVAEVKPFDKTEIKLISSMCSEGFIVLEFEVDLTKEDREYLRLDMPVMTEKDWENYANKMEGLTEEEKIKKIEEDKKKSEGLYNSLRIIPNATKRENYDGSLTYESNSYKAIIDGKEFFYKGVHSSTNKLNDYKYQVFLMYFFTEEQLNNKTEFMMTLDNIILTNGVDVSKVLTAKDGVIVTGGDNEKFVETDEKFNVALSKEKVLEDTVIIENLNQTTTYKKMTKKVDKVTVTPIQTVIKIDTEIMDVSLQSLSSKRNKDYIGIVSFIVCDQNGNEINNYRKETKRAITYSNGNVEEWAPGDIGAYYSFYNAKMNLEEYLVIETIEDIDKIVIKPYVTEVSSWNEDRIYLDEMIINIKDYL